MAVEVGQLVAGTRLAEALTGRRNPPGLSVALVTADGSTWSDGFGVRDVESRGPAARDTAYLWFSMTKLTTATAVVQLAGGGGFFNTMRIYPGIGLGLVCMGNRTSWGYAQLADALTSRGRASRPAAAP